MNKVRTLFIKILHLIVTDEYQIVGPFKVDPKVFFEENKNKIINF